MTAEAWITLAVVLVVIASLVREVAPASGILIGGVVALVLTGVLEPAQAFGGFANPATITIATLFVVARAVRGSGLLNSVIPRQLDAARSEAGALARLVTPVAAVSGFVNNTPVVATLAPLIRDWADDRGRSPSRYLMPLSFAAILGGMTTTIGTSTTLVVSGLVEQRLGAGFGLFEVTAVGLPVAVVGVALLILLAPRLVPDRVGPTQQVAAHAREYTFRMRVEPGGQTDGQTVEEAGLRNLAGVFLARLDRPGRAPEPARPDEVLRGGDVLTFVGRVEQVRDLQSLPGLTSTEEEHVDLLGGVDGHRFYEVVVGAESPLAGRSLKEAGFRGRYGGAVMAIHRAGRRVDRKLGEVRLQVGDALLLLADPQFSRRWGDTHDFLLTAELGDRHRPRPRRPRLVAAAVLGMLVAAGSGLVPILHAALGAVVVLLLGRVLSVTQARDAVDLDVILIVAGALGLGAAVQISGLAATVGDALTDVASTAGGAVPLVVLLAGTLLLTELVTNTAAAALMVPVAFEVAAGVGGDPRGFAVGVAVVASASFLTPVGYQTNTMVYGLGGYRYTDYWRMGLPLTVAALTVAVTAVALLWG